MKKVFKFGCLGIVAIVIIGIIGAIANGGSSSQTSGKPSTSTKSVETTTTPKSTKKATPKSAPKAFHVGQKVTVGKLVYTINKVSTVSSVGPSVDPTKANGKYVELNVTVINNGDKAVTIDSSYFTLLEGSKQFSADDMASMSANQNDNGNIQNSFFMQQLNPESSAKGNIVFDVSPSVASSKNLSVQVQEGIFGTVTETINLR